MGYLSYFMDLRLYVNRKNTHRNIQDGSSTIQTNNIGIKITLKYVLLYSYFTRMRNLDMLHWVILQYQANKCFDIQCQRWHLMPKLRHVSERVRTLDNQYHSIYGEGNHVWLKNNSIEHAVPYMTLIMLWNMPKPTGPMDCVTSNF